MPSTKHLSHRGVARIALAVLLVSGAFALILVSAPGSSRPESKNSLNVGHHGVQIGSTTSATANSGLNTSRTTVPAPSDPSKPSNGTTTVPNLDRSHLSAPPNAYKGPYLGPHGPTSCPVQAPTPLDVVYPAATGPSIAPPGVFVPDNGIDVNPVGDF